eukprot:scaffold1221_cov107-Isochrysis_galbana.AAC.5
MVSITQVRWVAGQTGKVVNEACIRYEKESVEQWHHCSAGTYNRIWSFTGRIAPEPSAHKSNRGASRAVAEDSSEEDDFPLDRRAVQREQRASRAKAQAKVLQKAATQYYYYHHFMFCKLLFNKRHPKNKLKR